jgi:uncharacterized protein YbaR (Trm112 family)
MFDPKLLKLLCCPETHQELQLAEASVVLGLNEAIAAGKLQNHAGQPVTEKIGAGLLRADGRVLYPLRGDVPLLLLDQAVLVPARPPR